MDRALLGVVLEDLKERMVFLSGPRQVGKTTLARQVLGKLSPTDPVYLNWDRAEDRSMIRKLAWSRSGPVAVLDEIHKFPRWKTLVKGFHDTEGHRQRLLVTGSARLDLYRRGGDSLSGRFRGLRLHPLSVGEVARDGKPPDPLQLMAPEAWAAAAPASASVLPSLLALGGFPEPFLAGTERAARRWRTARREQVLSQDLRDLTRVREMALVEQLGDLLQERVASPLSVRALAEDLHVDGKTVTSWIDILERLFVVFRVRPFAGSLARTLRKESKVYLWDWAEVEAPGPRFENLVACHLLKLCHWLQDTEGHRMELRYVRDREKREVDFLVLKDRRPWVLVEAKEGDRTASPALRYFKERLKVPVALQVVSSGGSARDVVPADRLLAVLP